MHINKANHLKKTSNFARFYTKTTYRITTYG